MVYLHECTTDKEVSTVRPEMSKRTPSMVNVNNLGLDCRSITLDIMHEACKVS